MVEGWGRDYLSPPPFQSFSRSPVTGIIGKLNVFLRLIKVAGIGNQWLCARDHVHASYGRAGRRNDGHVNGYNTCSHVFSRRFKNREMDFSNCSLHKQFLQWLVEGVT